MVKFRAIHIQWFQSPSSSQSRNLHNGLPTIELSYLLESKRGLPTNTFVSFNRREILVTGFQPELLLFYWQMSGFKLRSFCGPNVLKQCLLFTMHISYYTLAPWLYAWKEEVTDPKPIFIWSTKIMWDWPASSQSRVVNKTQLTN